MFALVDERDEERREIATRTISGSSFKQIQGVLTLTLRLFFIELSLSKARRGRKCEQNVE